MVRKLFRVQSRSDGQFDADPNWRNALRGLVFCSYCGGILSNAAPAPIDVILLGPPRFPVTAMRLFRAGIMVASRALLDILCDFEDSLIIGRCMTTSGEELVDYASCYTARPVELRGGIVTHYKHCPQCSTLLVSVPMAEKPAPLHVYSSELSDALVHTTRCANLIVDGAVRERLAKAEFPDLEFRRVRIVEPAEGERMTKLVLPG